MNNEKQSSTSVRSLKQRKEKSSVRRGASESKVANGSSERKKVAKIPLTQGKFAIVDAEDYEFLNQFNWTFHNNYAEREVSAGKGTGVRLIEKMHRVINQTPKGLETDHINGNTLDNRKCNLRNATRSQNRCNQGKYANNTSGFKGVYFRKNRRKWTAQIGLHNKQYNLGLFATPEAAYKAYCKAAKELHKEFARVV